MRLLTAAEVSCLTTTIEEESYPDCTEAFTSVAPVAGDGLRDVAAALVRDRRIVLEPCAWCGYKHAKITHAGRLALKLRGFT